MKAIITLSDINALARTCHADESIAASLIAEAERQDIKPKIGDALYLQITRDEVPAAYDTLLDGGEWQQRDGTVRYLTGLRTALAYYAYARIIRDGNIQSTRFGAVIKTEDNSAESERAERQRQYREAFTTADGYMSEVMEYLSENAEAFGYARKTMRANRCTLRVIDGTGSSRMRDRNDTPIVIDGQKGDKGDKGDTGDSAYQSWLNAYQPEPGHDTEEDFINWLQEPANGAVRYDIAQGLSVEQQQQACANIGALRTIPDASVSTRKIADGAVTQKKIADGAVTTSKIQDVAVTEAKLASQSVSSAKIKDRTIGASKLGVNSVTTEKIQTGAVTKAKLANDIAGIFDTMAQGDTDHSLQQTSSHAISANSMALGSGTVAGTKGIRWTAINFSTKTITLAQPLTGTIGAGALISIINDKHYDKCSKVAATAAKGATTLKVESLPFTSIADDSGDDAKTLMVYSNPQFGDIDLGDGAHAEGINTKATQRASHAEGRDTYAAGQYSHAEGRETEAFYASHAEGRGSKATGDVSHAEGLGTYAIGDHTHAEGQNTHAVGLNAHAEGLRGWANGQHSHAEGVDTVTSNTAEHAEGKFNKSNKADGSFGSAGNTLHSIGIGTSASDRKNVSEVMQNGDVYLLGVGGYDGKNPAASKAVQQVIGALLDTFKPVQVNDNKSGATDATQLAELKAYAAKLAAYGVDTTNGYEIPILYNSGSKGFIGYNPNAASSFNGYAVTPEGNLYTLTMNATTGALSKKILATTTVTDALSTNKQPKTDAALKTTSKTVTGAINEVNDKTAYVAFTDVTKLSTNLGKRLIYKGGNVTLSSPITINSNIYEIDFNGATITIGALARTGITAIKGHSHCIIKNLVIEGIWTTSADAVSNVLETFAGVENVNIDVHFSGSKYGRGFFNCQRLINCKAEITSSLFNAVVRGFSYCEYLYMCRIGENSVGEGFFHCTNMISCDALAIIKRVEGGFDENGDSIVKQIAVSGCSGKELVECSNYMNFRRCTNVGESTTNLIYGFFSDTDNLSVNGYSLTPFANTIAVKNEVSTKALVHPSGGTGVAEIVIETGAFGNTIARRLDDGRLKAAPATEVNDVVNKSQLDALVLQVSALRQTVTELQTEVNALKG